MKYVMGLAKIEGIDRISFSVYKTTNAPARTDTPAQSGFSQSKWQQDVQLMQAFTGELQRQLNLFEFVDGNGDDFEVALGEQVSSDVMALGVDESGFPGAVVFDDAAAQVYSLPRDRRHVIDGFGRS